MVVSFSEYYEIHGNILADVFTSVWLRENLTKDIQIFFCPVCRNGVIQYRGDIVSIIPGTSESQLPIIVLCKKCRTKYIFHQVVKKSV
jgi:RNase P subunit RPR2